MRNIICLLIALFLLFTNCSNNLIKCENSFKEVVDFSSNSESLIWQDSMHHIKIYICSEKPSFSTDIPLAFLRIKNYNNNRVFEFYGLGSNYDLSKDSIITYKYGFNKLNGLEGWYYKDNEGIFVTKDNKKLIYENGLLYNKKENNYHEVVGKEISLDGLVDLKTTDIHLISGSLYKYNNRKLKIISSKGEDIITIKSGIYYIPSPGTSVECIFDFKILAAKFGD